MLALVVVGPATRTSQPAAVDVNERVRGFLRAAGWWGLGVSLLSGVAWLFLEAALMSGQPIAEVTSGGALWLVLTGTGFGRVWMWRFGIATALGALMFAQAAATRDRSSLKGTWLALALAGGYLASLALVGHAADGHGAERFLRITTDVVHLLAAGAWLGALPGLAVLFAIALRASSAASLGIAARAARRFSTLGIASVGALLLSGLGNAWYLVGDVPALLGTPYGQLLVAKILLFATMVALAATNRRRLTPQVEEREASALRLLTRNAVLEIVAGIAIVAIVGALGVAIPAAHQSPVWPFSFTLSLEPVEESARNRWILGACIATLCVIVLALAFARARGKRVGPQTAVVFGGVFAAAVLVAIGLLAKPAYPTSYAASPVKYTTRPSPAGLPPMTPTACNAMDCMGVAMALRQRRYRSSQSTSSNMRRITALGIFSGGLPTASRTRHAGLFSAARRRGAMDAGSIPACTIGVPNGSSLDLPRGAVSADHGP